MFRDWPFFTALIENAELSLAKADADIAEAYLARGERDDLARAIRDEFARTSDLVLAVAGHGRLLDCKPELQRAIELRNPYVDALSFLQLRFLNEHRGRAHGPSGAGDDQRCGRRVCRTRASAHVRRSGARLPCGHGPVPYSAPRLNGRSITVSCPRSRHMREGPMAEGQVTTIPALDPGDRLLCGPGPSNVHPKVLEAMQLPMNGHLDPDFWDILLDLVAGLRALWRRGDQGLTLSLSSSGTSAMEAGFMNLVDPGDDVISCHWGFFGSRLNDFAHRVGANVTELTADFGQIVSVDAIMDTLAAHPDTKIVSVVHAETSTGAEFPLQELAEAMRAGRIRGPPLRGLRDLAGRPGGGGRRRGGSTTPTPARRRPWGARPGSRP